MSFKDQLLADLAIFYDTENGFAEEVVYIAQGSQTQVNVAALVDRQGFKSGPGGAGKFALVRVQKSEVAGAGPGDDLNFDGKNWKVARIADETPREFFLECHSEESSDFGLSSRY